jgi:hypothetical protein
MFYSGDRYSCLRDPERDPAHIAIRFLLVKAVGFGHRADENVHFGRAARHCGLGFSMAGAAIRRRPSFAAL